jgi:hypothetical protein
MGPRHLAETLPVGGQASLAKQVGDIIQAGLGPLRAVELEPDVPPGEFDRVRRRGFTSPQIGCPRFVRDADEGAGLARTGRRPDVRNGGWTAAACPGTSRSRACRTSSARLA